MIEVIKCGTFVVTYLAGIRGMITAVTIRFDRVVYEVTYFSDSVANTIYLCNEKFECEDLQKMKIGFKK